MAERLSPPPGRLSWPLRTGGLLAVAGLVLLMHAWLGHALWRLQPGGERAPFPERLAVVFLQELQAQTGAPGSAVPRATPAPALPPAPEVVSGLPIPAAAASAPLSDTALESEPSLASAPTLGPAAELPPAPGLGPDAAPPAAEPSATLATSATESPAQAGEPGPEWPLSTQLRYRLHGHYRGEVTGEAEVQWLRQGSRYQVHLEVLVGARFAPLIQRRMSSDGLLGANGIRPQRYQEETRMLMRELRRLELGFDRQARQLRLADGSQQPLPEGVQDAASQFVQLTWLFLTGREQLAPGRVVAMPLALPRRLYAWRYEVLGEELLDTPMGPLPAWHLRPLLDREQRSNDLKAEVWLAPGLQYLPVRLRIAQDEETYLDLMLRAAPLQAAQ